MAEHKIANEILNHLGGNSYVSGLMSPKFFMAGPESIGIRLKRANKNKINHIEITAQDVGYKIDFWAFPKDFMNEKKVASFEGVSSDKLKETIEGQTNFVFQKGDSKVNEVIANEILDQLGGKSLINAMLGVERILTIENGVSVTFKVEAAKKINTFEITLNSRDLYDVKYLKVTPSKREEISSEQGLYCDMLVKSIEEELQCALRMPKFI